MKKIIILLSILCSGTLYAAPKYGPDAQRLFQNHDFIKKNPAPDFWALMPYYVPQFNSHACSVASVTAVMNALRAKQELKSDEQLVTQKNLLEKVNSDFWSKAVSDDGKGTTLDELGDLIKKTLTTYEFKSAKVTTVHMEKVDAATLNELRSVLKKNETTASNMIVANFHQGTFTGDPEGVGHISPLAAYDSKKDAVLIFDTDREWYEPYWVSVETLAKGMNTKDSTSSKTRGYVLIETN